MDERLFAAVKVRHRPQFLLASPELVARLQDDGGLPGLGPRFQTGVDALSGASGKYFLGVDRSFSASFSREPSGRRRLSAAA
jgi:hypothetical protein